MGVNVHDCHFFVLIRQKSSYFRLHSLVRIFFVIQVRSISWCCTQMRHVLELPVLRCSLLYVVFTVRTLSSLQAIPNDDVLRSPTRECTENKTAEGSVASQPHLVGMFAVACLLQNRDVDFVYEIWITRRTRSICRTTLLPMNNPGRTRYLVLPLLSDPLAVDQRRGS